MGLNLKGSACIAAVIAVLTALTIAAFSPVGAVATSSKSAPVAHSACRPYLSSRPNSPCKVGNVLVECGYGFGACTYSKYLKCKLSAEEGTVVKFIVEPAEKIEGTRIENPHKKVTCKGPAAVLQAYLYEARTRTTVYQRAAVHRAHSFSVTLYFRRHGFRDDGLVIFAKH